MDNLQANQNIVQKKNTVTLQTELRKSENVEQFVRENQSELVMTSVQEYLNELLRKYNIEKCDVAKRGGFVGNYLYQIFSGKKKPSRDKLIQIALGFPLTVEETQELLRVGEYSQLYVRNSRDAFLMFAVEKKFEVPYLNELLYKNGQKILE